MIRSFDFPEAKMTLSVGVEPGSPAALATPEMIRDCFQQKGAVREIDRREYKKLTKIYNSESDNHD